MSRYCQHNMIWGRCPRCEEAESGYVPPPPPPPIRLNLDRSGLPRDYATYVWLLYKRVVADDSPARRAFLNRPGSLETFIRNLYLPEADPLLMGTAWK